MNLPRHLLHAVPFFVLSMTFLGFGRPAQARMPNLSQPSDISANCESLVNGLESFATTQNLSPALSQAMKQIRFAVGDDRKAPDSDSAYSRIEYSGLARKLPMKKATLILSHLNRIALDLSANSTDKGNILAAYEIRGDNITKALAEKQASGLDKSFSQVAKFLKKATSGHDTTQIFFESSGPIKFERGRISQSAAYRDQILYFDKAAGYEPVWLLIFRGPEQP